MTPAPASLVAYIARLEELADAADPSPLLAHSYVRYLGDLSGGQTIRHTVSKAYGLDENAGFGLSFYVFKSLRSQVLANQGEMKRIKEWFREGMNAAGTLGVDIKGGSSPRVPGTYPSDHPCDYIISINRERGEQCV